MTNLVLFGDSITAGITDGYPSPILSNEIRKYFPNIAILNRGVPGDRTDLALSRIQADVIQSSPDIVTIFFGTNDVTDEGPDYQTFISNIKEMVTLIAIKKCILITPGITGPNLQNFDPNQRFLSDDAEFPIDRRTRPVPLAPQSAGVRGLHGRGARGARRRRVAGVGPPGRNVPGRSDRRRIV